MLITAIMTIALCFIGLIACGEKKYEVTFDANGGTNPPAAVQVVSGEKVTMPKNDGTMTREGYTFTNAWYKEASCTNQWKFGVDTVTSDITLYAGWESNEQQGDLDPDELKEGYWGTSFLIWDYYGPYSGFLHLYPNGTAYYSGIMQQGGYFATYKVVNETAEIIAESIPDNEKYTYENRKDTFDTFLVLNDIETKEEVGRYGYDKETDKLYGIPASVNGETVYKVLDWLGGTLDTDKYGEESGYPQYTFREVDGTNDEFTLSINYNGSFTDYIADTPYSGTWSMEEKDGKVVYTLTDPENEVTYTLELDEASMTAVVTYPDNTTKNVYIPNEEELVALTTLSGKGEMAGAEAVYTLVIYTNNTAVLTTEIPAYSIKADYEGTWEENGDTISVNIAGKDGTETIAVTHSDDGYSGTYGDVILIEVKRIAKLSGTSEDGQKSATLDLISDGTGTFIISLFGNEQTSEIVWKQNENIISVATAEAPDTTILTVTVSENKYTATYNGSFEMPGGGGTISYEIPMTSVERVAFLSGSEYGAFFADLELLSDGTGTLVFTAQGQEVTTSVVWTENEDGTIAVAASEDPSTELLTITVKNGVYTGDYVTGGGQLTIKMSSVKATLSGSEYGAFFADLTLNYDKTGIFVFTAQGQEVTTEIVWTENEDGTIAVVDAKNPSETLLTVTVADGVYTATYVTGGGQLTIEMSSSASAPEENA